MNRTFNNLKNKDSSNLNLFGIALLVILFSSSSYGVLPDFTELVEKAAPAVVKINTISVQKTLMKDLFKDKCPIFSESFWIHDEDLQDLLGLWALGL